MVMLATYWKRKTHCKKKEERNQDKPTIPVCSLAHTNCIQIPQIQINRNQLFRASSNICTHKAGGYPVTTVNCSLLHSHTYTHTQNHLHFKKYSQHTHSQAPVLSFCISTTCQMSK